MAVEPPESQAPSEPPPMPPPPNSPRQPEPPDQSDPMDLGNERKRKYEKQLRKELKEAVDTPVPDQGDEDLDMEPPPPTEEVKRKFKPGGALDDLPFSIRKKFNGPVPTPPKKVKYDEQPQGLSQLPMVAMCYAVNEFKEYDEWVRP